MTDASPLYIQWLLLRMIPRQPQRIDTTTLKKRLEEHGIHTTARSIQRNLEKLAGQFPLHCLDTSKPFQWSWARDAPLLDVPGMDPATAFTFSLASTFLQPLLPRSTLHLMEPHFERAKEILGRLASNPLSRWADKVRVIQRAQSLVPPSIDEKVMEAAYDALLHERRMRVEYRKRGENDPTSYDLNPIALIVADSVLYLLATVNDYNDVLQFLMHRMVKAEVTDTPSHLPTGFDIDGFLRKGHLGFMLNKNPITLRVRFTRDAAITLLETPLSRDQRIVTEHPDGSVTLEATVPDTRHLRGWLFSYADQVEVLEPMELREEFHRLAQTMANRHAASSALQPPVDGAEQRR